MYGNKTSSHEYYIKIISTIAALAYFPSTNNGCSYNRISWKAILNKQLPYNILEHHPHKGDETDSYLRSQSDLLDTLDRSKRRRTAPPNACWDDGMQYHALSNLTFRGKTMKYIFWWRFYQGFTMQQNYLEQI